MINDNSTPHEKSSEIPPHPDPKVLGLVLTSSLSRSINRALSEHYGNSKYEILDVSAHAYNANNGERSSWRVDCRVKERNQDTVNAVITVHLDVEVWKQY